MPDRQYEIGLRIDTKSDDRALTQSTREMQALASATDTTTGTFTRMKEAAIGALGAITAAFSALKIIQWLTEGAKAAMEQARALSQLSAMAKQFGQDGAAAAKAAQALGDALRAKGFDDDVIVRAVRDLIPVTRDYVEALSGATLAADISAKTGMEYAQALSLIQMLISGSPRGVLMAHRELGIAATEAQGALDELRKTFGGSASALDDNKQKVDSLKAAFDDLWKTIGGPVAQAFVFLIDRFKDIGHFAAAAVLHLYDLAEQAADGFAFMGRAIQNFITSPLKGMGDALDRYNEDERRRLLGSQARWEAWADAVENARAGAMGPGAPGKITARPVAGKAVGGTKGGKVGKGDTAILEAVSPDAGALVDAAKTYRDFLTKQFRAIADYYEKVDALRDADTEAERKAAEAKKAMQMDAINMAIGMAVSAFPQSREIAAASAMINTYQAATKALAEGGPYLGPILMAVMIALGMAQVANIYATEPGAAAGGAGSAPGGAFGPPIRVTPSGGAGGAQASSMTTVNTNAPVSTSVTINALTGADGVETLRRFEKMRRPGSRAYERGIGSRQATAIGTTRR